MAKIQVRGDSVEIEMGLGEEILALHGSLRIPLRHVRAVRATTVPVALWRGIRVGANIPGVVTAGTFLTEDGAVFYDIRHGDRCVTLELDHERYTRVVIELDATQDPAATAAAIEAARPPAQ